MKKFIAIILAALCVFALCACGNDGGSGDNDANKTAEYKPDYGELYYASGEVKFGILDPAADVLTALGEPDSTFESNSCAYQGKDKFYYYDGFEVLVNDVDGTERITGITIADDTVSNPQGVKIGMKIDERSRSWTASSMFSRAIPISSPSVRPCSGFRPATTARSLPRNTPLQQTISEVHHG